MMKDTNPHSQELQRISAKKKKYACAAQFNVRQPKDRIFSALKKSPRTFARMLIASLMIITREQKQCKYSKRERMNVNIPKGCRMSKNDTQQKKPHTHIIHVESQSFYERQEIIYDTVTYDN